MCTVATATTIIEVLDEMVQNQDVFTAFDVTMAVRGKVSDTILHNEVRNIVNNEFITQQLAGYDRELCSLNVSGNPQAFVYFPDGKSVSDHDLVISSTDSDNDSDDSDEDLVVDLADDEYRTTKEGRVQIPKKLLSQVSPNGGSYDILINGTLKCVSADARGDVRICLKQLGINDDKVKLIVNISNNSINLETV